MVAILLFGWLALTPAQAAPSARQGDYRVGPQDVLGVTVFGEDELSRISTVGSDGTIDVALVGRVQVGGKTLREIEKLIESDLKNGFLNNPQVSVEMKEYRSQTVFVTGEVRTPGTVALKGNMSLMEALAEAGSITQNAGDQIVVVHPRAGASPTQPLSPSEAGASVTRIDLEDLQEGRAPSVTLHDGDTIVVPRAEKFYVTGFVRSPGAYPCDTGLTVLQAISLAGGVTERGSHRGIKIRRNVDGTVKEISVKDTDLVQPGDTIVVRQRVF